MRIAGWISVAGGWLVAGCMVDLAPPPDAHIVCSSARPVCPAGYRCAVDVGACLPVRSNDNDAPRVEELISLAPDAVSTASINVVFRVSEALAATPTVVLRSGTFVGTFAPISQRERTFAVAYQPTGGEPEGVASITVDLIDLAGNTADDLELGTVVLDFSPPEVTAVSVLEAVGALDASWVQSPSITLTASVTDAGTGVETIELAGDLSTVGVWPFAATLSVALEPSDGDKAVIATFADQVGNRTAPVTLILRLEQSAPVVAVVVDEPAAATVVNRDSLRILFHAEGELPADLAGFVSSTDGGGTWSPVPSVGVVTVDPLAQDAVTTVLIRAVDVFGNQSSAATQGAVIVREDSVPPTRPQFFTKQIASNLGSGAGVLLYEPSLDPGGFPITYQAIGGANEQFQAVGAEPWFLLPGVREEGVETFVLRAVDEAGNASPIDFVSASDGAIVRLPANAFAPIGGYNRKQFGARDRKGFFSESRSNRSVQVCTVTGASSMTCGYLCHLVGTADVSFPDAWGRYVVFAGLSVGEFQGVQLFDLGPDELAGTDDDVDFDADPAKVTPALLDSAGDCAAVGPTGVVYRQAGGSLVWRGFGSDHHFGTGDDLAPAAVPGAAAVQASCVSAPVIRFNGRHILWLDVRAASTPAQTYLYDLGPDGQLGTADDEAETLVGVQGDLLLEESRLYVDGSLIDLGQDRRFGTGDDTTVSVPEVVGLSGDKVLVRGGGSGARILLDLSTGHAVELAATGPSEVVSFSGFSLATGVLFFGAQWASTTERFPAFYDFAPRATYFASAEDTGPGGAFAGDVGVTFISPDGEPKVTNLVLGGKWTPALEPFDSFGRLTAEVDVDGTCVVFRDDAGAVQLYDVGVDERPGTADDRGPIEVVAAVQRPRWPRIAGAWIVWADTSADADGDWTATDLVSHIEALDLGPDLWPGGGDDLAVQVTSGGREIFPDVSDGYAVWLDARADADGQCLGSRGEPDPTECNLDIYGKALPSGSETPIETNAAAQAGVVLEHDWLAWTDFRAGNWDIFVAPLGGAPVQLTQTPHGETQPALSGDLIGYVGYDVVVIRRGADAVWGTADDAVLRPDDGSTGRGGGGEAFVSSRLPWLTAAWAFDRRGLLPFDSSGLTAVFSGEVEVFVPDDDPIGASSSLTVDVPAWRRVDNMRILVSLNHADVSELRLELVSPSADVAVIYAGEDTGPALDRVFDLGNAPQMMNHSGEPLAGIWQLRVIDTSPVALSGTLHWWQILHSP